MPEKMKCIIDLDEYMKLIKGKITPKPYIKLFNEKKIKMNEKYLLVENLKEDDLYEEDEEDIKSLGQSLEKSIDKCFVYSLKEKINDYSINDSNLSENIDENSKNTSKNIINKLKKIIIRY